MTLVFALPMGDTFGLPDEVRAIYVAMKRMADGRLCGVHRLLYHWTLHVGIHELGYEDRYCYATKEGAISALEAWDGTGDPIGWHRHPATNRRRDVQSGHEWIAP